MPKAPAQPSSNPPAQPPVAAGLSPAELEKKEVTEYAGKALFELSNLLTKRKNELKGDVRNRVLRVNPYGNCSGNSDG